MSIIISGMEMPDRCSVCPCAFWTEGAHYDYCQAMGYDNKWKIYESDSRPNWCPLTPVPPHGRLIDADALKKEIRHNITAYYDDGFGGYYLAEDAIAEVDVAPTIIPAEEGE